MKQFTTTLFLVLFSSIILTAQERSFLDIEKIFEDAVKHMDNDEMEDAITELEKIPSYDSTYESSALELSKLYMNTENYEQSLEMCEWGMAYGEKYTHLFYQNKGACYLKMGEYEKALEATDVALKLFPERINLIYNKGLIYKTMKKYKEAKEMFQQTIRQSPYYASAHFELGSLALRDNETARMMMCFNMYLMCQSNTDKGYYVLTLLDHLASAKKDSTPVGIFKDSGEDFSRLNLILDNYVALEKGYKTGTKVNFSAIKQNHLLFTQLAEMRKGNKGFWTEFYVPIYKALVENKQFQNYTWYLLRYSANESHLKLAKKNAANIAKYKEWWSDFVSNRWNIIESETKGELATLKLFYDNDGLKSIGQYDKDKNLVDGDWKYYYYNGILSAEGAFKESERTGEWKWYHNNGKIKTHATNLKKGKIDGEMTGFYTNGNLESKGSYTEGDKQGIHEEYYLNGNLYTSANYEDGELDGISLQYFANGIVSDSLMLKDGKVDGTYTYFHNNGQVRITGFVKDEKRSGVVKEYFSNGTLESEYNYVEGKIEGIGKEYFVNGKLSFEGKYENGKRIGIQTSYRQDGSKYFESNYDENGKENGGRTYYDYEGNPHEVYVYSKGIIAAYQFLDKDGNVVNEAKKKGNNFEYKSIYFDGTRMSEGQYNVKGGKEGSWEFYNTDGILASKQKFDKNTQDGKQVYYHPNGKIKREYTNKDGKTEGEFRSYFITGTLEQHGRYINDLYEGEWITYETNGQVENIEYYLHNVITYRVDYDVDGQISVEQYYKEGLLDRFTYYNTKGEVAGTFKFEAGNGKLDYRFENNQLQSDGTYVLGKREGAFKYYHFDGRLSSESNYYLGKRHGSLKYYFENKQLSEQSNYVYGVRQGEYLGWDRYGNKEAVGEYVNGQKQGVWTYYYPNGKIESRSEYDLGEVHGKREFYAPSGDLQMIRYYDHDVLTSYSYLGEDGKPVAPIKIDRKDTYLKSYFPNGTVSREYQLTNGMIQGVLKEYLPNGKPSYIGTFVDDDSEGERKEFDENGAPTLTSHYENGQRQGMYTEFWANGKKRLEIPYILGTKHGLSYEYDKTGKKTIERRFYNNQLLGEKKL